MKASLTSEPPPLLNSMALNKFSLSPSGSAGMSQELARIDVDDLRRENGWRLGSADVEPGVSKV